MARKFRRPMTRRPTRERFWLQKSFAPEFHPTLETAYFELLHPDDYTEGDNPTMVDHCTVLRTVGRIELDWAIDIDNFGTATGSWVGAIVAVSLEALNNAIIVDPLLPDYSPFNTAISARTRVLHHFGYHTFSHAEFRDTVGTMPATDVFMSVYTGDDQKLAVEWDVKQKVKMKSDMGLYLALFVTTVGTLGEGLDWIAAGTSRTLFAD